jgi:hypothetical protein
MSLLLSGGMCGGGGVLLKSVQSKELHLLLLSLSFINSQTLDASRTTLKSQFMCSGFGFHQ